MTTRLRLDDVRRAWESSDPDLPRLVVGPGRASPTRRPRRPSAKGRRRSRSSWPRSAARPSAASRRRNRSTYRVEQIKALESPDGRGAAARPAPAPRDHRQPSGEDNGPFARSCLLEIIARRPARVRPLAGPEADLQGGRGARRHRGLRRAGRPVRHGLRQPARRGQPAHARLPPPPRLALPPPDGRGPARPATPTPPPTCWPTTTNVDDHWAAPGSPTTSSIHETGEYDRTQLPAASTRPSEPAEGPGLRRPLAAQPPPAVRPAGAGPRATGSASSPPRRLKADFRASLREVEPALGGPAGRRRQPADRRVRRLGPEQRPAVRAGRVPHRSGCTRRCSGCSTPPPTTARGLRRRVRPDPRPRPAASTSWSAWPTTTTTPSASWPSDLLQARDPRKEVGLEAWGRLLEIEARPRAGRRRSCASTSAPAS